ncbi:DUF2625 family protein [Yinghuangia soli]|uniref:DUF2625 domain-containing protein n=1 Tax=Yinghuangia soli TaxID=2908204 RepID=A0AA41U266_9ACTN|nr:DUF2625 family protein [Yinghuangia soli]MCF2530355.1 DUF2625 domain-containing protein [Yinghuangia soli]
MRALDELLDVADPAWPLVADMIEAGAVDVAALPGDAARGQACLLQLQVTARSFLGAVALSSGGMLVDGGWLRVYGGAGTGAPGGLPGLAEVNGFPDRPQPGWLPDAGLVLAHDVLGGTFALNGHDPAAAGRPGNPGEVIYFAPDALTWESLGAGHGDWLAWLLDGEGLAGFYASLHWPGRRDEVAELPLTHGLSAYPFLWTEQAQDDPAAVDRRPVTLAELLGLMRDMAVQVTGADPGPLGIVAVP